MSKDYDRILGIIEFLGDCITDDQCAELMDQIKRDLSKAEQEQLLNEAIGPIYTDLSQYNGECDGFERH